jgi:hypothetical protein
MWWGEFAGTPLNETGVVVEVLLLVSLLVGLHIVKGLQHCLHKLVLGGDQLFKVNIVVGVVVVVVVGAGLAIALAISYVHHLMVW